MKITWLTARGRLIAAAIVTALAAVGLVLHW